MSVSTAAVPHDGPRGLRALAAATPDDRDRAIDLYRGVSIVAVAVGHWLIAVVGVGADGALTGTNALSEAPALQWLTWLFQVMPLFFLVGGWSNAASWRSARRRGLRPGAWVGARLRRLTGPATVHALTWTVIAAGLAAAGMDRATLTVGAQLVAVPVWFLAVYVVVVALTPAMLAAHERTGLTAPVALAVLAATVDVLHRSGVPLVGWTNFVTVWLVAQQLGFAWADGLVGRTRRAGAALAVGGFGLLAALTLVGPYPVSMVGVPGAEASNNAPPTVALVALAVGQLGLAVLLRPGVRRWCERPRVWLAVIALNARAMTIYLWHLSAVIVVALALVPLGVFGEAPVGSGGWWVGRLLWIAALVVALAPIVALAGRFERPAAGPSPLGGPRAIAATAAFSAGFALLATTGFSVGGMPGGVPVPALAALLTGRRLAIG